LTVGLTNEDNEDDQQHNQEDDPQLGKREHHFQTDY